MASLDGDGRLLVSDVNSGELLFDLPIEQIVGTCIFSNDCLCFDPRVGSKNKCQWVPLATVPIIAVKSSWNMLHLVDSEKQILLQKNGVKLDESCSKRFETNLITFSTLDTYSMDWRNDGNLLLSGGTDKNVKIYDRRARKAVKIFKTPHVCKHQRPC